jgi:hypothetical protein
MSTAISATGTDDYVDRLIDMIGTVVPQDPITGTRSSAIRKPEFIKHVALSEDMIARYLDIYYVFDPLYAHCRRDRRTGVAPLKRPC